MKTVINLNISTDEELELKQATKSDTFSFAITIALKKLLGKACGGQQLFCASKTASKKRWVWINSSLYQQLLMYSMWYDVSVESVAYTAIQELIQGIQLIVEDLGDRNA